MNPGKKHYKVKITNDLFEPEYLISDTPMTDYLVKKLFDSETNLIYEKCRDRTPEIYLLQQDLENTLEKLIKALNDKHSKR